jgi:hypothetical protein
MPRLLTAAQIAEGALRRIGSLSPRDQPDPDELDIALGALDLIVGELAGTMTCYWLVPAEFTLSLTSGTASYDLLTALGSSYPDAGLQFPLSAYLLYPVDGDGNQRKTPVEIVRRRAFLAHEQAAQAGAPSEIYIDRLTPPTLSTWPVIDQTGYSLLLHYQTYSADLREDGGNRPHGLPAAWQRWAELATAADIADGPLGRLPGPRVQMLIQRAAEAKRELKAYNNREHSTRRAVAYRDF